VIERRIVLGAAGRSTYHPAERNGAIETPDDGTGQPGLDNLNVTRSDFARRPFPETPVAESGGLRVLPR
jgi:hypothetical protein